MSKLEVLDPGRDLNLLQCNGYGERLECEMDTAVTSDLHGAFSDLIVFG